ncbi:MAG TPA: bifunctional hexulose-6-phosphate synthase/ribonuclease regulator [Methanosarcina thermophila]|nr:3-hexulose-6-phosphate synthase [Methanosarcina thermophila]NLU57439.1 bifunctional hexulose-6-phosphate synthase/ribonuclease regulator [Methanosarcina thermophila]HOA67665.1 bifunctional hexulose-6-phosphate synthase/ribonuclease regulator [Methanosarcina thermophila]HOQ64631.1 bifunctional hexulose-6-phosphate synthase/ribonuclease regulator [Methanosarcina thermophila]HPT79863.1 bifunctional hexulose-6-phosphate synthase/ribonuclease regulator [Methanosarcina thermophila]HPZ19330.1 bifu
MAPIIQVALDLLELDRAVEIAKEAVAGGVDWIEIGTPLIKSEGMDAIRTMRKAFPERTILADMKTVDTGALEVEMAAKAGADVVIVLGSADDSTLLDALRSAHKYGVRLMADLISAPDPVKRAVELEALGVDYVNVHVGIDQQMMGKDPISLLREIAHKVNVQLAVAGGLDANSAALAVKAGARVVIVGGNITHSDNVTEAARKIRQSVDCPDAVEIRCVGTVDQEIREILKEVSTSNISDAMHRKGAMKGIHPLVGGKMVGTAVTVQTFPGDWAKPVEAIDIAKEGDVIVIYNESKDVACWGGLATLSALNKGIAGVVIEGAVRDIDEVKNLGLPIYTSNTVPNAGDPKGFGEINAEITCGGQTVKPGDYIVGDESGVVVIPAERAYELARRAKEVYKNEKRLFDEIKRGGTLSEIMELKKWEKH